MDKKLDNNITELIQTQKEQNKLLKQIIEIILITNYSEYLQNQNDYGYIKKLLGLNPQDNILKHYFKNE